MSAFEFTPEFLVFDLLNIPLYHGWLVDPQNKEMATAVGNLTYNQLVEKLLIQKTSEDTQLIAEGEWLNNQVTSANHYILTLLVLQPFCLNNSSSLLLVS